MAGSKKLQDMPEAEVREIVGRLRDIVYGSDFPEEGADMMEAIYKTFRDHGIDNPEAE